MGDAFDALTHDRVYRPALSVDQAVHILATERGTHFEPEVLDVFLTAADEAVATETRPCA